MKPQSIVRRLRKTVVKTSGGYSYLKVSRYHDNHGHGKYQILNGNTLVDSDDDIVELEKRYHKDNENEK